MRGRLGGEPPAIFGRRMERPWVLECKTGGAGVGGQSGVCKLLQLWGGIFKISRLRLGPFSGEMEEEDRGPLHSGAAAVRIGEAEGHGHPVLLEAHLLLSSLSGGSRPGRCESAAPARAARCASHSSARSGAAGGWWCWRPAPAPPTWSRRRSGSCAHRSSPAPERARQGRSSLLSKRTDTSPES